MPLPQSRRRATNELNADMSRDLRPTTAPVAARPSLPKDPQRPCVATALPGVEADGRGRSKRAGDQNQESGVPARHVRRRARRAGGYDASANLRGWHAATGGYHTPTMGISDMSTDVFL